MVTTETCLIEEPASTTELVANSPASESDQLRARLAYLEECERTCQETAHRILELKEELKAATEEHKGAVATLRRAVRRGGREDRPLFDGVADLEPASDGAEAWRSVSIDALELPPRIATCLLEHKPKPIATIGDLADYTSQPHNMLTDIKGIGGAAANQIDEALTLYWQRNPVASEEEDDSDA